MLQVWRAHLAVQDTADVHETDGACTAPGHLQGCIYHISPNTPRNFMIFVAFCSVCVCPLNPATCLCSLVLWEVWSGFRLCLRRVLWAPNSGALRSQRD